MSKKIKGTFLLSVFISFLFMVAMPQNPASCSNTYTDTTTNITWGYTSNENDKTASIDDLRSSSTSNYTEITIPKEIKLDNNNTYTVTSIGSGFAAKSDLSLKANLTTVTIPDTIKSIGSNAFLKCTKLTTVNIEDNNLETIDVSAFKECTELTEITIPDSVTKIDNYAFYNCKKLKTFTVPDNVTELGQQVFRNCTGLTSVVIGKNVPKLIYAFTSCSNLESIFIRSTIVKASYSTFFGCEKLSTIKLPCNFTVDKLPQLVSDEDYPNYPSNLYLEGENGFKIAKKVQGQNITYYDQTGSFEYANHENGEPKYTWTKDGENWKCKGEIKCALCDELIKSEEVKGEGAVTKAATCSETGTKKYTATFTDTDFSTQTKEVEIPKTTHNLNHENRVDSTCTTPGHVEGYTCSECGKHFVDAAGETEIEKNSWIIPATDHSLTSHEAKATTCTEAGNSAYWSCSKCRKYFSDAAGTTEIEENSWIIPATDHSLTSHEAKAATCTEAGNSAYWSCSKCGKYFSDAAGTTEIEENSWIIPATNHSLTSHEANSATCTEAGNRAYWNCSKCEKYFSDAAGETEIEENSWIIPATNHSLTSHEAKSATCTEAGNRAYWSCSKCGKYFSNAAGETEIEENSWIIPATEHNWRAATYMWSYDNCTCTAKKVCENDASHIESETVVVTTKVTDVPNWAGSKEKIYTATFTKRGFGQQTKRELMCSVDLNGQKINCILQDSNNVISDDTYLKITLVEQGSKCWNELFSQLDDTHNIKKLAFFDIELLYKSNNKPVPMPLSKDVRVLLQIPEGWSKEDLEAVLVKSGGLDGEFEEDIVTIDGANYVAFITNHFSPYALIDKLNDEEEKVQTSDEKIETINKKHISNTGEPAEICCTICWPLASLFISIMISLKKIKST